MKRRLVWESRAEDKLVQLVHTHNNLWDPNHPHYTNVSLRNGAFQKVAEALGDRFTVKAVKERWTNIKNTYMHNLKRVEKTKETAQYPEDVYEPSWHLWEKCQFLSITREHKNKNVSTDMNMASVKEENERDFFFNDDMVNNDIENNEGQISFTSLENLPSATVLSQSPANKPCEKILNEALQVLKTLQNQIKVEAETGNSNFTHISRLIANRLSKMKRHNAECAIKKIMEVLSLYDDFHPNNSNQNE